MSQKNLLPSSFHLKPSRSQRPASWKKEWENCFSKLSRQSYEQLGNRKKSNEWMQSHDFKKFREKFGKFLCHLLSELLFLYHV
jgi:hypothetical protein